MVEQKCPYLGDRGLFNDTRHQRTADIMHVVLECSDKNRRSKAASSQREREVVFGNSCCSQSRIVIEDFIVESRGGCLSGPDSLN